MKRFIDAVRLSVRQENWYGALMIALTMPDICGRLQYGKATGERYAAWFDRYVSDKYNRDTTPDDFMSKAHSAFLLTLQSPEAVEFHKKAYTYFSDSKVDDTFLANLQTPRAREFFSHKSKKIVQKDKIELRGFECYALRCSMLHEGTSNITGQSIVKKEKEKINEERNILDDFVFSAPPGKRSIIHKNKINNKLQLQVDIFCEDMCCGVEVWMEDMKNKAPRVSDKFSELVVISIPNSNGGFSV